MFETFGRSWQLVKASWSVLQADKELLWFPVLSGVAMIAVSIALFIPTVAFGLFTATMSDEIAQVMGFIGLFIYYLITYTVGIYFNTALIGAAMIRLDGGDPTFKDGIEIANARLSKIVMFAAMSATVGVILRMLQERGGVVGNIVSWLGGMAWSLATFLVIPVLVVHDLSPWDAVKRSTSLLRETWGEQITGSWSIGGVFFLLYIPVILIGGALIFAGVAAESMTMIVGAIVLTILAMILLGIIQGALSGVYQAALYRFAETGAAPDNFDIDLIRGAFKPKRKRG
ncbi:MAG: DUF6159 family protein [Anaerolineae bacterium]